MKHVTDIQHARTIISEVGEKHQKIVVDMLRSLTYYHKSSEIEREAQKVIQNMEHEYTLNVANVLWVDNYDKLPKWIKDYDKTEV